MSTTTTLKHARTRRSNTEKRYAIIRDRVNEVYSQKVNGIRLDFDDVIDHVAKEFGFSQKTIRNILKG